MLANSVIVIGVGVLMLPILRPRNKAIAGGYLGTRIFEGVSLAIGAMCLLVLTGPAAIDANFVAYNVAEAGLASAASSVRYCSASGSFRVSWRPGVSSGTRCSPRVLCWSCSALRASALSRRFLAGCSRSPSASG